MLRTFVVVLVLLAPMFSSIAQADVGPPPTCPAGKHREYLYGHRCVPDGSHLERGEDGSVIIVKDGEIGPMAKPKPAERPEITPTPTATATATATANPTSEPAKGPEFATPPAPATATAAPAATPVATANPPSEPPSARGCTCGVPGEPEERIGFGLVISALIFTASRRIRGNRRSL